MHRQSLCGIGGRLAARVRAFELGLTLVGQQVNSQFVLTLKHFTALVAHPVPANTGNWVDSLFVGTLLGNGPEGFVTLKAVRMGRMAEDLMTFVGFFVEEFFLALLAMEVWC
jgi:hypothetical protein